MTAASPVFEKMTYEQASALLESRKPAGMQMGLERMRKMLQLLGNPQTRLRTIHIAGTNGKGSTAAMIRSILTAAGYRTGLYDSPAVTGLRDTITVDGVPISPSRFAALTQRMMELEPQLGEAGPLTEFEFTTALALTYFMEESTDLCVVECGLGGRDDATNVIPPPLAAVLTPIALDHTAMLGERVEEIAAVKCGICKPPCTVVVSPGQSPEALGVILETAAVRGLTVRMPNPTAAPMAEQGLGYCVFDYDGGRYRLPLTGVFQRDNALTALETVACLAEKGYPVAAEAKTAGLAAVVMPCRQEILRREPLLMLDGAHNPHGVGALADTLAQLPEAGTLTMLMGMLRDKNTAACAALLGPLCARVICCTPSGTTRALPGRELAEGLRPFCGDVAVAERPADAVALARDKAASGPQLIAGSYYLCGELRPFLLKNAVISPVVDASRR